MDDILDAIEEKCPGAIAKQIGALWQITLPCGAHAGARAEPMSLLDDLLAAKAAASLPVREPDPLKAVLDRAEQARDAIADARTPKAEAPPEQPPEAIADLMDDSLTARQNMEALIKKYGEAMSEREMALSHGETSKAMVLLRKAERFDSGIKWNRARLAEAVN